jgi:hypothetical protein
MPAPFDNTTMPETCFVGLNRRATHVLHPGVPPAFQITCGGDGSDETFFYRGTYSQANP